MSATSHWGTQPSGLSAGWQLGGIGDRALRLRSGRQGVDTQEIEGATDVGEVRATDPQVSCGGLERLVAKEALDGARVDPRFEPMRGTAMAEGMEAFAVVDMGGVLGVVVDPLGGANRPRVGAILPWK